MSDGCTFRKVRNPRWGLLGALATALLLAAFDLIAQAPGVPVIRQGRREKHYEETISAAAEALFRTGTVAKLEVVRQQLKRTTCKLDLPAPKTLKLSSRELWTVARDSHLRVGWAFLCRKCDQWHVNLAGGYAITDDGILATCYHVVQPDPEMRDGCLIAADEDARVYPVAEILAAHRYSDSCLVRLDVKGLRPLALNTNVHPGDAAYCYSDPLEHRGYFSSGIVNRFYQFPGRRSFSAPESANYSPTRLNVSTDWAPGSSGSAVLDECGNAIGHVSTISALMDEESPNSDEPTGPGAAMIIFHEAVSARDVLRLISPKNQQQ